MLDKDHSRQRKKKRGIAIKRAKSRKTLRRKRAKVATNKEIEEHLNIALKEIGAIEPWFDEEVGEWIFKHPLYPVEYGGESKEEVVKNYPEYVREFLKRRLNDRLDPLVEQETKGHGGKRVGAGRPRGAKKPTTKVIRLPADVADWFESPSAIPQVRAMIAKGRH